MGYNLFHGKHGGGPVSFFPLAVTQLQVAEKAKWGYCEPASGGIAMMIRYFSCAN